MADLATDALRLIELYGPLALAAFTFLESSMLFPFLPSELVVPAAAAVLVDGPASFVVFVLAAGVGGTAGAFALFYVVRANGSRGLAGLRRYVSVSDESVERGRAWFRRWGQSSVLWGRFLPGLRSVVSVPAGLAGMTSVRFGAYTAIGTVGFYAAVGAVVYYGKQRSLFAAIGALAAARPALVVAFAVGTLVAVLVVVWYRRVGWGD